MPRILLVEDDGSVRQVIEQHLLESGHSVVIASDTGEALHEVRAQQDIDLLLVDLVMPADKPDGLAFAELARKRRPDARFIFMTGYYGFVARAGRLPGPVLYKPIDLDVLTREIDNSLAR